MPSVMTDATRCARTAYLAWRAKARGSETYLTRQTVAWWDSVLRASQCWRFMLSLSFPTLAALEIKGPFHDRANHRLAA